MEKKISSSNALKIIAKMVFHPSVAKLSAGLESENRSLNDLRIIAKKAIQSKQLESKEAARIYDNITRASMLIEESLKIIHNPKTFKL